MCALVTHIHIECLVMYMIMYSYVYDFMPNQNGFFLSYLMLVPVLSIQYTFLTAVSFLTDVHYVGASVCGSWTRVQRGTCHVGSCSDLYTVLLFFLPVCLSLF